MKRQVIYIDPAVDATRKAIGDLLADGWAPEHVVMGSSHSCIVCFMVKENSPSVAVNTDDVGIVVAGRRIVELWDKGCIDAAAGQVSAVHDAIEVLRSEVSSEKAPAGGAA